MNQAPVWVCVTPSLLMLLRERPPFLGHKSKLLPARTRELAQDYSYISFDMQIKSIKVEHDFNCFMNKVAVIVLVEIIMSDLISRKNRWVYVQCSLEGRSSKNLREQLPKSWRCWCMSRIDKSLIHDHTFQHLYVSICCVMSMIDIYECSKIDLSELRQLWLKTHS